MPEHPGPDDIVRLYRSVARIRRIEERIAEIYPTDKIKSPVHLSIGQEAISVGVIDVLEDQDVVSASYRGHAAYLAKGGGAAAMIAELYGKATGCAAGKGGSMHLIAMDRHVLGMSAVVATHIPHACGYALALKRQGSRAVVAVFFGDGATEEGVFYESLNFAALHKLPVLFVCENNGYAIHTPLSKRWASPALCHRVAGFGLPAHQVPQSDIFAIRAMAQAAVAGLRAGGGPVFLECQTYRWREHVGPAEDYDAGYRARADLEPWQADDQLERLGRMLPPATRAALDREIQDEIAAAIDFAETSPVPDARELYADVFAP